MSFIYCFTNLINQKQYIGSSTSNDPNHRYSQHIYCATHENSDKYNYPLYCAFRKYGIDNFKYEILEYLNVDEEIVRQIEQKYIFQYNTLSPNGYNQTIDTQHPINDPTTYVKIKEIKRDKAKEVAELNDENVIINKWRSIVDCAEQTGYEQKKIAACCRGERHQTSGKRFCWLDDNGEPLLPIYTGDIYKGKPGTTQIQKNSKKVAQYDLNGNYIKTYDTIALAARENNCDASGISKTCRGQRKYNGGYIWKYVE